MRRRQERGLELVIDAPAEPLFVEGDATRLAQVLGNLLSNAAKFTPSGGRISLEVGKGGESAVVRVRDTGIGITEELLPLIFEPFTQAQQNLARTEGGLGLGLALVKGLVGLHGGSVAAASAPATGTVFTISLPLTEAVASPSIALSQSRDGGRAHRVLVVDDNADAAESLAELVRMFGHEAEVAHDGPGALALVEGRPYDLVLCDIGLPGISGYEV